MIYRNLAPGAFVRFRVPAGKDIRNGQVVQAYRTLVGRVNPLLRFDTHVVAAIGNKPYVVNDDNFVEVLA